MSNGFKTYDAHNNTNIRASKSEIAMGSGVHHSDLPIFLGIRDVSKVTATLLDLQIPIPQILDPSKVGYSEVYSMGGVNVSANSDPDKLRKIAVAYLAAADMADQLKAKIVQEEAVRIEELRAKNEARDEASKELYGFPWAELCSSVQRGIVEKYLAISQKLAKLEAANNQ